ncbi:MAG TPA: hypothetical protein PKH07_17905, partial [bacterium]|nr:hypothetical protein [bacterium]
MTDSTSEKYELGILLRSTDSSGSPYQRYGLRDKYTTKKKNGNLTGVSLALDDFLYLRTRGISDCTPGYDEWSSLFEGTGNSALTHEFLECGVRIKW